MKICAIPLLLVVLACSVFSGCQPPPPTDSRLEEDLGPEESLEVVMDRFKRNFNHVSSQMSQQSPTKSQHLSFRAVVDDVTHKLQKPVNADGKYTAEVTIRTSTYFTMLTSVSPEAEEGKQKKEELKGFGGKEEESADDDFDIFAQLEGSREADEESEETLGPPKVNSSTTTQLETVDLEYLDGEWRLMTSDIDPAVKLAFEYALGKLEMIKPYLDYARGQGPVASTQDAL